MKRISKPASVHITNLYSKNRLNLTKISRLTQKVSKALRLKQGLSLVFLNDTKMRTVNREYHGVDETTDVLAFESPKHWPHLPGAKGLLGEIVISVDRVIRYAKEYQVKQGEELMRYVIHGILHLLGERDHRVKARAKMFIKQEKLLRLFRSFDGIIR
ncbi:MAG: rRNA maturation RNase YbeY [Candidatus Omnitrophica bacterium CG11_big_fil_rev_8_21_14_0_20_45_26]|uniref:Endoribonuclease YbeY n=1 Tax=Candidatus Abzuiibacterium crystallinum TaxID=1974748 RepID=A0A2H0LMW5_9BACT|nr:MAG: rRNA maturation RNase YbeY [Candidatus Omnitrophica bacterium CG11_big_fil_rev_8_21_14_0_20_45_26]PIW65224.1 MAG: rRNA maturation RNase YbeY [Candidatus Omnitrophica bacterium CG12_big_fil_rev_8_21_14_0_65_45_16]